MIPKFSSVVLASAIIFTTAHSEWVSLKNGTSQPAEPRVTVLRDDPGFTELKIELSGFEVREFPSEGKSYRSIDLLTDVRTNQTGRPELPYIAKMLAIPDNGGVTAEVIGTGDVERFSGYVLPPARMSRQEGTPESKYVENEAAYRALTAYPETFVTVDEPVVFRDFRVARVAIYPVRYVAGTKEVQITSSVTVRIRYGGGIGSNPKTRAKGAIARSFGAVYRSSLINYQNVLEREYGGLETGREVLLCIVPDTFAAAFKPYAEWKHKTGTYVQVTKFSEIGANSSNPDIIKNYVAQCYHTWQYPPTYVLLVGDYGQVPIKAADGQSFANDDYFVEIDGADVFPEVYIGRFTHDLTNPVGRGLQTIVNKLMKYESDPYRVNQDWFKHAVLCSNLVDPTQADTKRWVSGVMRGSGGFITDTLLNLVGQPCAHNLPEVISAINSGRGYLNYRGEGGSAGWWASCYPFNTTDVSTVNNGEMLTFVTSIGCGVAMFNASGGNCFGEQWLELGTPTSIRGACAFIGPTWGNTHAIYNNEIDKGLYVALLQEGLETPGQTLLRGKIRMYNTYGGGDPQVLWHFRTYTVLGDASIHIWKEVPRKVEMTYTPVVSLGYDEIQVTVFDSASHAPVDSAEVCVAGDSVYVIGMTDATGQAIIPVASLTIDTLTLLVRGKRVVPAEGTVLVIADQEHVAPLGNPVVTDIDGNLDGRINPNEHALISYVLKNWGGQPSADVQATLSVLDTNSATVVNAGPVSYGTLPPNGSASGSGTPLQFHVKSTTPVGSLIPLQLHVSSSTHSWDYTTYQQVFGCNLTFTSMTINDLGSPQSNGRLDPGETAIVYLTITNDGQDAAPNVTGILRSADPHITIPDSVGSFGTLPIGGNATNTANYFVVTASDLCPLGSAYVLTLQLSTQNGSYAYAVSRDFPVTVGLPSGTDPTGPDPYGYYAYSADDSLYEQAPEFNWIEIRSVGTRVPWASSGDFTATATLPFTFKYYGRNYTSVRVSSDGWLAFGSGTQTAYNNYPLPHTDAIANMVALFWDDLFEGSSSNPSKLLYYSDVANHRFIVEWDSVGHWSGTTLRETFQAILLDPAFYPTPTGDGEILFQYQVVGEETGCTVGIEDSTQTIGLQYVFNNLYTETATNIRDGSVIRITTQPPTVGATEMVVLVPIESGWNLVSNPVQRPDSLIGVRQVYPHALSDHAFRFDPGAGYVETSVLTNGPGFWTKFPDDELNPVAGIRILRDTIAVDADWNIIGSISSAVDTSTIISIPPGLRATSYFGYFGGYAPVTHLDPGLGYWVKMNGPGQLVLSRSLGTESTTAFASGGAGMSGLNSVTIRDSRGGSQTLYFGAVSEERDPAGMCDMPPLPPAGAFDARFETSRGGSMVQKHSAKASGGVEFPVTIQSDAYPLTVTWNVGGSSASYELTDGLGGRVFRAKEMSGKGSVTLANSSLRRFSVKLVGGGELPKEFALSQNFPNPFNPSTTIKYDLPLDTRVSLKVFNILGQEVATLVNEEQKAGYRSAEWNAGNVASGVYFYRLEAGHFTQVRKMLLTK
jgi:hypothetical protein